MAETTAGAALLARSLSPPGPPRGQGRLAQALSPGADGDGTPPPGAPEVERTLTIGATAPDLYERFRSGADLPAIWGHMADISPAEDGRTRWAVHGPLGRTWSWETKLTAERRSDVLSWAATEGADVPMEGTLTLRPAPRDQGTEATLSVTFEPPGGRLGRAVADHLDLVPREFLSTALRRWKALVETGEIPTTDRNPAAR